MNELELCAFKKHGLTKILAYQLKSLYMLCADLFSKVEVEKKKLLEKYEHHSKKDDLPIFVRWTVVYLTIIILSTREGGNQHAIGT